MPTMIVKHTVADFGKWKQVFDAHSDTRKKFGSLGGKVYQSAENPNEVTIVTQWGDLGKAKEFAASPDLKSTMEKAGVTGQPQIQFLQGEAPFTV